MIQDDTHAHWRDSALTPRFFMMDARGALAILLLLLRPHWYTLVMALVVLCVLAFLNYKGLSLSVTMRLMVGWLSGPRKIRIYRV